MHLIECLSVAPIEYLQSVSSNLGANAKFNSKSDLIQQISRRLRTPEFLQELIAGFESETRLALRFIVYLGGIAGLPIQQSHQKLLQIKLQKTTDLEQIIYPLISHGLIYTSSAKSEHIPRYIVPQDIRTLLIPILTADIQSRIESTPTYLGTNPQTRIESIPTAIRNLHFIPPWAIIHDTFSFLSYLRREPPQVSKDNQLHKKTILEIEHLFEVKDKLTFPKGEYPTRLRLIIYFCRSIQLISQDIQTWRVNEEPVLAWLDLSKSEQLKSIYQSWTINHLSTLPEYSVIITILAGLPIYTWVTVSSLFNAAYAIMPDANWEKLYPAETNQHLFPGLYHLGLIQLGENKLDKEPVLALTDVGKHLLLHEEKLHLPEEKPNLIIQPNFEMLLDATCPMPIRWELELFADPIKVDRFITLRLNKRALHRAFEAGYTTKKIFRFLQSLSEKPIPQNVVYTLEEWEKQYGRIYFADLFLLRCDNELLAKEIQSSAKLKPYILGTVSPKDLIINKKQYSKLVQLLKEEGYLPNTKVK